MIATYRGVGATFQAYWRTYGGIIALLKSPYLHFSLVLTFVVAPLWCDSKGMWFDVVMSVVPSVLGFSLGGYAILLAFGDEQFRLAVSGSDDNGAPSPFMVANAAFIHFIVVSSSALLYALIAKAWGIVGSAFAALGVALFIYSVATALAAAFAIHHVASWYDDYAKIKKKAEGACAASPGPNVANKSMSRMNMKDEAP